MYTSIVGQDFSKLTDEEIVAKIQKLSAIVRSPNQALAQQAWPILQAYNEEQVNRNNKKFQSYLEKSGVKVDEIIDIG